MTGAKASYTGDDRAMSPIPPSRERGPSRLPTGRALARVVFLSAAVSLAVAAGAPAQPLPPGPFVFVDGRVTVSGDASVAFSTSDHETYFNYGDYQHDGMRLIRLGLAATLRAGPRVTAVADLRAEGGTADGGWQGYPVKLYASVRPFASSSLSVAAGIVQPAFGAFMQRRYGADNLLIGYPLAYQYTTGVRADALPASVDEVLSNRARGWEPDYAGAVTYGMSGVPLVNPNGWRPGVSASAHGRTIAVSVAVTKGGLALPGRADGRSGWETTGRVEFRPTPGLALGVSGAHGSFIDERLAPLVARALANRDPRESALGVDAEYSEGYWLVRVEAVFTRRTYPVFSAPYLSDPLTAVGIDGEVRYKIRPGLYAAARVGRLSFGTVEGSRGPATWDADVTRLETGLGYFLSRNVLVKAVYQYNRRDSTESPSLGLVAAQAVVRF